MLGITTTRSDTLKLSDMEAIEKLECVKATSPFTFSNVELAYKDKAEKVSILGVLPIYPIASNLKVFIGRFIEEKDVMEYKKVGVLGYEVAKRFGLERAIGEKIKIGGEYYTIIGILEKKGSFGDAQFDERIYVPITTAQKRILNQDYLQGAKILIYEGKNLVNCSSQIRKILRFRHKLYGIAPDDFYIVTPDMAIARYTATSKTLKVFLLTISIISLVISGIIIMNLMKASIEERAGIIALRIALGASSHKIILHYLSMALIMAFMAGFIGWIISIILMVLISFFTPLKPLFTWTTFLLSLLFSSVTCIIFSLYPAFKATKINPALLLKSL